MTQKNYLTALMTMLGCLTLSVTAFSQKLPDSQETGLRAPKDVKIDGKAPEWGTLQAFSKNTQISYSLANDDSTLYLVVQSSISQITSKIMSGGVTFTMNNQGKKKDKGGVSVTFPVPPPPVSISSSGAVSTVGGGAGGSRTMTITSGGPMAPESGSAADIKKRRDSIVYANNLKRIDKFKDIKVIGVPSITDSLLSVYNDEGIKARCGYEEKGIFTYELALPFKYLGIDLKDAKEFMYNIKLNGLNMGGLSFGGANMVVMVNGNMSSGNSPAANDFQAMMSPTDFWGKYTPVK